MKRSPRSNARAPDPEIDTISTPTVELHLDTTALRIVLDDVDAAHVDYTFHGRTYAPDPKRRRRLVDVGEVTGKLRVHRAGLRCELLQAMALDRGRVCFARAAQEVLRLVRRSGTFPERIDWAGGA